MTPLQHLQVGGVDVLVEGQGEDTLLMLHGWPDTLRLWDGTVLALQDRYRCVRFTLPGFDLAQPARAVSLDAMQRLLLAIADAVAPGRPVTLVLHDWGCMFGYEFAHRYPHRVARIVGLDIGDHHSPALRRALGPRGRRRVAAYQLWLALAWVVGRWGGTRWANRLTRWQVRQLRCPVPPDRVGWQMNYPYAMKWLGVQGGMAGLAPVAPTCPMLFFYGTRKYFMFHSPEWLAALEARAGSAAMALRASHWLMLDMPVEFHAALRQWLDHGQLHGPRVPSP